jgi:hypothetical protein
MDLHISVPVFCFSLQYNTMRLTEDEMTLYSSAMIVHVGSKKKKVLSEEMKTDRNFIIESLSQFAY